MSQTFTTLNAAVHNADTIGGCVCKYGNIYRVYRDTDLRQLGVKPCYVGRLTAQDLAQLMDTI